MAFPIGYTSHQPITTNKSKVIGVSHAGFVLFVDLSDLVRPGADLFNTCRSDGGDIRVTASDGTTQHAREIVAPDTVTKTGIMWVYIPVLSGSVDTEIQVWYNGTDTEPAADSTYGSENAWPSKYKLVLHMNQDPSGTAPQILDSTSNANNGVASTVLTSSDLIDGQVGKCIDLSSTGALITVQDDSTLDITGALTVQAWAQRENISEDGGIVAKIEGYSNASFSLYADSSHHLAMAIATSGSAIESVTGTSSIRSISGLRKLTGAFVPSTSMTLYLDGSQDAQKTTNVPSAVRSDISDVWIGADYDVNSYPFKGPIDEVRIIAGGTSADLEATEYNNQNSPSTFYSVGDEVNTDAPLSLIIAGQDVELLHNKKIDIGAGYYTIAGQPVSCVLNRKINAEPGVFTISGQDMTFGRVPVARQGTIVFLFTLTGEEDGVADVEIQIKSIQARLRSGDPSYLKIVIPYTPEYAMAIASRPNSTIQVDLAYEIAGEYTDRETIIQANLEDIRIDEGPLSKSISLTGHKQKTYTAKSITLSNPIYKNRINGQIRYRFAEPNLYLYPGDTVTVGDDTIVANVITYYVNAYTGGVDTSMEIAEA